MKTMGTYKEDSEGSNELDASSEICVSYETFEHHTNKTVSISRPQTLHNEEQV